MCDVFTLPRLQVMGGPLFNSRFDHQESVTIDNMDLSCGEPADGFVRVGPSISVGRLGATSDESQGKFAGSLDVVARLQAFSSSDVDDSPIGGGIYTKAGVSLRGFQQEVGAEIKWITDSYISANLTLGYAVSEPVFEAGPGRIEHGPVFGLGIGIGF